MPRIKPDPTTLGTSTSTIRTVASGVELTYLRILLYNRNSANRTVSIWYVPSGDSPGNSNKAFELTLLPDETRAIDDTPMLQAGDSVRASASNSSSVTIHLAGLEEA